MDNQYRVSVTWMDQHKGSARAEGVKNEINFSTPPEFGGEPGFWSPEQLLVAASNSCYLSSFLFFAEHSKIPLAGYHADAEGHLQKIEGKGYQLAQIILRPVVVLEQEKDMLRAQRLLEKAERACIVTNSLLTPVRIEPRIEVLQQAKSA